MTVPVALGLTLPVRGLVLRDHGPVLDAAGRAGFTELWTGEASRADAFTPLAWAAARHPGFLLGTSVVSAYTRGPALLAMSAAALAEMTTAPVVLGIGSSSSVIVEGWNGIPFTRPLTRMRDTVRFLREALSGGRVTFRSSSFDVDGFRLEHPPTTPPRIMVAALRERMLRLAAEEADGVILNWLSADDVRTLRGIVHSAGRTPAIAVRVFVVAGQDADAVDAHARRQIAAYLNVPVYAQFQRWLGRDELTPMWDAWGRGDRRSALEAIPHDTLDALFLTGTPERIAARLRAYADAGVDHLIVDLTAVDGDVADHLTRIGAAYAVRNPPDPLTGSDAA